MPDRVIMVRESEWREMREALRGCQGVLADLNRPRGAPESIPNLYARSVEAEAKARAALAKAEATATQPVAHAYVVDGECEQIEWGGVADYPDDPALVWLYTHPAPPVEVHLIAAAPDMLEAAKDALAGWRYIREHHGDLYGVGWDRVERELTEAISKAEGLS